MKGQKIFVSSSMDEAMKPWRVAAFHGIEGLDFEALEAEDLPASPSSSQGACLSLVDQSSAVVLLLGKRYGTPQESGLSATEEEINEARKLNKPVLVFVVGRSLDSRQRKFLQSLQEWAAGVVTKTCEETGELTKEVVRALRKQFEVPRDPAWVNSLTKWCLKALPKERPVTFSSTGPWVAVAVAPLRPLRVGEVDFFERVPGLLEKILFAAPIALVDQRPRIEKRPEHLEILGNQDYNQHSLKGSLTLQGALSIGVPFRKKSTENVVSFFCARPSDAQDKIRRILGVASGLFDVLDGGRACQGFLVQAGINNLGMVGFRESTSGSASSLEIPRFPKQGSILAFGNPEQYGRDILSPQSDLPSLLVKRLQRKWEAPEEKDAKSG